MRDVAFVGRSGTGKTTLAQALESAHGFKRLTIADGIREIMRSCYGEDSKTKTYTISQGGMVEFATGRALMIELGHALRKVDALILMRRWLLRRETAWMPTVTDDVRLDAEQEFIRAWRPTTLFVRLTRAEKGKGGWHEDITERRSDELPAELVLDTETLSVGESVDAVLEAARMEVKS